MKSKGSCRKLYRQSIVGVQHGSTKEAGIFHWILLGGIWRGNHAFDDIFWGLTTSVVIISEMLPYPY
jgi:hypothetical protein